MIRQSEEIKHTSERKQTPVSQNDFPCRCIAGKVFREIICTRIPLRKSELFSPQSKNANHEEVHFLKSDLFRWRLSEKCLNLQSDLF